MKGIFIGLGSSLGDAKALFQSAEKGLLKVDIEIVNKSSFFKNPPYGGVAQNKFTNAVWEIKTDKTPEALLEILQEIEDIHGRERSEKWDDRTLDLDILVFGGTIRSDKNLIIPHPEIDKRIFVLKPLAEIVPSDFEIPKFGKLEKLLINLNSNN